MLPPNRVTWANTTHDSGLFAAAGQAYYTGFRWGDYTSVSLAGVIAQVGIPVAGTTMWWAGMYSNAAGNWNTVIGKNAYNNVNQP